jgi:uncharacterized protein YndB with AHSA1/START domain
VTEPIIQPYKNSIVVNAPQERAFKVFTESLDKWWPRSHSIAGKPQKEAIFECREGGRWYEISEDGSECDWGNILIWAPPSRLVIAWQIDGEWQYDPDFVTEIEVTFTADGASCTRVDIEHRNLDRYGAAAAKVFRDIGSDGGWPMLLDLFAKEAAA